MEVLLLVAAAVFLGAAMQRVTGLGFGLVSGPVLVLALGAFTGVVLANLMSLVVNLVLLALLWRQVLWRRTALLAGPALLMVPAGALVVRVLPGPVLSLAVGLTVLLALVVVLVSRRGRLSNGNRGAVIAGAASGFMNATAAVGGPAVTVYAISTGWRGPGFVASLQLYFAVINAAALLAKGLPSLSPATWLAAGLGLVVGSAAGHLLSRRVSFEQAFPVVVGLALVASSATVVRSVLDLV